MTESARDVKRRELYAQHVLPEIAALLRVARSMTPQASDAQDLVQDTLLRPGGASILSTVGIPARGY